MGEDFNGGERFDELTRPAVRCAVATRFPALLTGQPICLRYVMAGHELNSKQCQRLILETVSLLFRVRLVSLDSSNAFASQRIRATRSVRIRTSVSEPTENILPTNFIECYLNIYLYLI